MNTIYWIISQTQSALQENSLKHYSKKQPDQLSEEFEPHADPLKESQL